MNFHSLEIEKVIENLDTSLTGLSQKEAERRLEKFGENKLPEEKRSLFLLFIKQFKNIFNIVLFFALILTIFIHHYIDSFVILFIILINAFIGFYFELKTEKSLEKLKNLLKPKAKVLRDKEIVVIDQNQIVVGDIVLLEEGDIIPADVRFFEVDNLKVDESIITGESLPVEKDSKILKSDSPIAERKNIGYMGSYIVEGKGRGIVFATGINTYLGKIYKKFQEIENFAPHFERLSRDLILKMFLIALFTSILIFYLALKKYHFFDIILFVLSSFISSIPEGLPVIITVLLVISAYSLSKKNVLVRNLNATENLSVINLLLSDKTGTLTENLMTVRKIFVNNEEIEISGEGLNLEGRFLVNNKEINIFENYPLIKLFNILAIVSEGEIIKDTDIKTKGSPRDIALLVLLEKANIKREAILETEKIKKREPFSRIKKYKKVIVEHERVESYYIGAFEKIIQKCNFILKQGGVYKFEEKDYIFKKGLEYAENGFSVLGVSFNEGEEENNLIFVGLVALYDPPKKGIKETIKKLKKAGIDIRILTGDHKATAIYIAKEIGFDNLTALEESEIEKMTEKELKERIKDVYIFARITPETKLKILKLYQELGYSVAYIGDGVNDVLGLKRAEVGICMGKRGSEIAKSASDIVLTDDNLESLVNAFLEGRRIFNNLKRVVFFLITTNVAEHITILTSLILGYPFILKPTHILFLNLVTDTLVGTTLAFEKEHGYELQAKPRSPKESLINLEIIPFLLIIASTMAILSILIFSYEYLVNLEKARTYAFLVMSLTQIYNAINLRSLSKNIFTLSLRLNLYLVFGVLLSILLQIIIIFHPFLRNILGFAKISFLEFFILMFLSSIVLFVSEIFKLLKTKIK